MGENEISHRHIFLHLKKPVTNITQKKELIEHTIYSEHVVTMETAIQI